jgi:hypothetical protein
MFSVTLIQQSVLLFANLFSYSAFLKLLHSTTYKSIADRPPVASTVQSLLHYSFIRSLADSFQHSATFSHNIVIYLFVSLLSKIHLLETTNILVQLTDKETVSVSNATYGHAQDFLGGRTSCCYAIYKHLYKCTVSLHTSREA